MNTMNLSPKSWMSYVAAGTLALLATASVSAQVTSTTTTGTGVSSGSTSTIGTGGGISGGGASGGSSGGGSFSGGSGASGGSGGSGASGGSGFSGGTGGTGGTGTTGTRGGQSTTVPSTVNPFNGTYKNPMALGLVTSTSSTAKGFGQPLYGTVTTSASGTGGTTGKTSTSTANGFSTQGYRRAPAFFTTVSEEMPLLVRAPVQVQTDLKRALARSSMVKSGKNIEVVTEGDVVVLRGQVLDQRERRLAEGLVRVTPGVREVRNELQIWPNSSGSGQ